MPESTMEEMPSPPVYHFAPVANYYGTPYVTIKQGVPLIGIEDHDGESEKEISPAFYQAWLKEFGCEDSVGSAPITDMPSEV